jgi:hypothetical protein
VGFFSRRRGGLPDDAVEAEAKVLAMGPTARAARQTGKLDVEYAFTLAVQASVAAGPAREVELTCVVPHERMPLVGQAVPIRASAAEPTRVEIDFDRVPSLAERATASARAAQEGDPGAAARALGFTPREPDEKSGG